VSKKLLYGGPGLLANWGKGSFVNHLAIEGRRIDSFPQGNYIGIYHNSIAIGKQFKNLMAKGGFYAYGTPFPG